MGNEDKLVIIGFRVPPWLKAQTHRGSCRDVIQMNFNFCQRTKGGIQMIEPIFVDPLNQGEKSIAKGGGSW